MSTKTFCDACDKNMNDRRPNEFTLQWYIGSDTKVTIELCSKCMEEVDKFRVNFMTAKKAKHK